MREIELTEHVSDDAEPNPSQKNLVTHVPNRRPVTTQRTRSSQRRKQEISLENYEKSYPMALEKIDPKGIQAHSVILDFSGSVLLAELYEGTEDLATQYEIRWGEEWREDTRNLKKQSSQSQYCEAKEGRIVFDLPFDRTLSCSGTPNSWPQLILVFKGFDVFGHKVVKGYAQTHLPMTPGRSQAVCHIYSPQPPSGLLHRFQAWISGTSMQYKRDFQKIIIKGEGREVGRVKSIGAVKVVFNLIMRNFANFGFQ